jgi:WD40 repeat protein
MSRPFPRPSFTVTEHYIIYTTNKALLVNKESLFLMIYFSSRGQYIVAGSDDGSFFIWDRHTTNLMRVLRGDESIVNCLQPHPSYCLLATSGIDPVVRLWSPRPEVMTKHIHPLSAGFVYFNGRPEKPAGKDLSLIGSNSSIFNLYFKGAWFKSHQ